MVDDLAEHLIEELNWRIEEISIIKKFLYSQVPDITNQRVFLKYSIVALYALWEGFVNSTFGLYIQKLNRLSINTNRYQKSIITNDLDNKYQIGNNRTDFNKRIELTTHLYNYFNVPLILSTKIPTKSNVNFKVINNLLSIFHIEKIGSTKLQRGLDKLLFFRNNIAHGDFSISIDNSLFNNLSLIVIDLMVEVIIQMENAYANSTFLQ